jgi:predicted unusual protein kinase regulating ubiquinone biosynthesis (AarF/ABC1/UbiB family)
MRASRSRTARALAHRRALGADAARDLHPGNVRFIALGRLVLLDLGLVGRLDDADYPAYERESVEFVDNIRVRGLANLQVTLEIGRIFDILRRHRIQARSHMTVLNLALMTAEGLGKRLAPELSLTDAALPYLAEALAEAPAGPDPEA